MDKPAIESQPQGEQAASLDLIAVLNRRKGWLVLSCLIGLGIGAAYYFLSPRRFESRAELLLMQNSADTMSTTGNTDRDVSEELLSTHMKLVQSSRIVKAALEVKELDAQQMAKMDEASSVLDVGEEIDTSSEVMESLGAPIDPASAIEGAQTGGELIPGVSPAAAAGFGSGAANTAPTSSPLPRNAPTSSSPVSSTSASSTPASPSTDAQALPESADTTSATTPSATDKAPDSSEASDSPASAPVDKLAPATVPATPSSTGSSTELIAGVAPAADGTQSTDSNAIATGAPTADENVASDQTATGSSRLLKEFDSILQRLDETMSPSEYVLENLYVTTGGSGRARNARVLNIAFRHTSPKDCETITRAIVHQYQEFVKTKFRDINNEAAALIATARRDIEHEIKQLDDEYRIFRQNSPLLSRGATGTDIYTTRFEELAAENSQLAIQRDEAAGRLQMVKDSLADFDKAGAHNLQKLSLIDDRNAERLGILVTVERGKAETATFQSMQPERMAGATAEYSSLLTMKTRLSQLKADFGPEYPEVKSLEKQIAEMDSFLSERSKALVVGEDINLTPDDVMRAYVSMLEHDLRALDQRTKDIEKQMTVAEEEAKKLISVQLEDESRIRSRERNEELYNAVIERLRDINLKKEQSPLILELIQEPTIPEKVEPKGIIAAAISMLCALLLGGVGVLVAELRDRSVHSPEEFEELLGSRVLAHLPNFQNDPEIRKLQRVAKKSKSPLSPSLLTFYSPDSRASETFRALRTQVMFSSGGDHKILSITSSNQGAGKSMLSSNMAVSMAGLGIEVLLIDCDMRLPQVHRLFGVPNEKGLADAIANPEDVSDFLIPSGVDGLTLLPSGQAPANPAEVLSRPECKELLESLRQKFSYIILDCPPVLAVSDPSILAPLADGVLFVSVVDNESRPKTMRAKKILQGVGARILGIVVNRSDESSQRYGYQAYGYESIGEADNYYAARPVR